MEANQLLEAGYRQPQWSCRFSNTDFVEWLVGKYGKPGGGKQIILTGDPEIDIWTLAGIWDGEGSSSNCTMNIRMKGDLDPLLTTVDALMKRGPKSAGVYPYGDGLSALSWPAREWARIGMGTFARRKAKNGIRHLTEFPGKG